MPKPKVTVVLVHGAWAECSSWNEIILPLQKEGLGVVCAPIPLTSLRDDVDALDRALGRIEGDIVLVGHAYAGAVIGATKNNRVKLLIYVAALAPDEGETVADVFFREPPQAEAPQLSPDADGYIWMSTDGFDRAFAQNASADLKAVLAATQRPINIKCIQEKAPRPLWKDRPSWLLVAENDRMIAAKTQNFEADRMRATVRTQTVDHSPMLTSPQSVIEMILEAVQATFKEN
ncbi:MAG TPA: alpha/beta hydrolase [Candidatus Methylacidiphilales bacterium]|nr:alpha/beta hydrolase [Candidatus Methylacidiphilales bacterium]